jgi:U3 small nucleolar RNA-associated protein 14
MPVTRRNKRSNIQFKHKSEKKFENQICNVSEASKNHKKYNIYNSQKLASLPVNCLVDLSKEAFLLRITIY